MKDFILTINFVESLLTIILIFVEYLFLCETVNSVSYCTCMHATGEVFCK